MPLILPNDIANDQLADGDRLQQNFTTIEDWANQEAITRDGSTAMTQALLLPGPPTQPNQAATKDYIDAVGAKVGSWDLTYVPSLYNGAQQVTCAVNYCAWRNDNGMVTYQGMLNCTGTGAPARIQWSLPRSCPYPSGVVIGTGQFYDSSSNALFGVHVEFNGTSLLYLRRPEQTATVDIALAAGDGVMWTVTYRTTQT